MKTKILEILMVEKNRPRIEAALAHAKIHPLDGTDITFDSIRRLAALVEEQILSKMLFWDDFRGAVYSNWSCNSSFDSGGAGNYRLETKVTLRRGAYHWFLVSLTRNCISKGSPQMPEFYELWLTPRQAVAAQEFVGLQYLVSPEALKRPSVDLDFQRRSTFSREWAKRTYTYAPY